LASFEAGGDDRDFDGVFHLIVLNRAKNNVGVFVRGFLYDGRGFVHFVQRKAGAAGNIDENALRALDGVVLQQRARDGAIFAASTARFVPVATAVPITA